MSVEIIIPSVAKPWVGIVVLAAIILLEARLVGKCQEPHAASVGTMKEAGGVAFTGQQSRHARVVVHRSRREHEGFFEHGNATEYRGHAVDALTAIAERVIPHRTLGYELVYIGRVAFVFAIEVHLVE